MSTLPPARTFPPPANAGTPLRLGFLGECMIELAGQPPVQSFGGDTLNTALYAARLLARTHLEVHYLTALGEDPFSQAMLLAWKQEGLHTEAVVRLAGKLPGLYWVQTNAHGERHFFFWRHDSAARHWLAGPPDLPSMLRGLNHLHLSGISLALWPQTHRPQLYQALSEFRHSGGWVSFDNNFRPALWPAEEARLAFLQVLPLVDVALLTLDDEQAVHGPHAPLCCLNRTLNLGCPEVVLRQGPAPAWVATPRHRTAVPACLVAQVVDTCAAGDSFAAAYLASRWLGHDEVASARHGHRLAAEVIQHPGAIMPLNAMPADLLRSLQGLQ
jgi:2-dehydro-3-deoxygluconokinase